jgi:polyisoprenoid-binding protein YceI
MIARMHSRLHRGLLLTALVASGASARAQDTMLAQPYRLDASHSDVAFAVGFLHGTKTRGRFDDLRGVLFLDSLTPQRSSLTIVIGAKSINTGSAHRDEHLRTSDFFDVARFPRIVFQSRSVAKRGAAWTATGDLTMHGVTRTVSIPFRPTYGPVSTPQGHRDAGFSGALRLARKDFGIMGGATFNPWFDAVRSAAVGDSVDITLDVAWWRTDFVVEHDAERDSALARISRDGVARVVAAARARQAAQPQAFADAEWNLAQLARALQARGRSSDAVAVLTMIRDFYPTSASAHAALGLGFELVGDMARAREAYDRALALDAGEVLALERRRWAGK